MCSSFYQRMRHALILVLIRSVLPNTKIMYQQPPVKMSGDALGSGDTDVKPPQDAPQTTQAHKFNSQPMFYDEYEPICVTSPNFPPQSDWQPCEGPSRNLSCGIPSYEYRHAGGPKDTNFTASGSVFEPSGRPQPRLMNTLSQASIKYIINDY